MNRRAFLQATGASALVIASSPWWIPKTSAAAESQSLLESAKDRIQKHRRREIVIRVRDASGKPVPGANVEVEQLRHEFLFGCNFFGFDHCGTPDLEEQYRSRFEAVFNYATLGFYWATYEASQGSPNYAYTDKVVDWAGKHNITCKGHPLAWDHPAGSPRWLSDDPAEIQKLSTARVREIVARYKGRIDRWDVVNEPTHLPDKVNKTTMAKWALSLGSVPYTAMHLREARQASNSATLLVNDYRTDRPYLRILEALQSEHAPFDCVGIQSHMHGGSWPMNKVWETCDTYAKLGLPLHFTETTLVSGPRKGPGENWGETTAADEEKQAAKAAEFYQVLFSHPAVQAITWWDFSDLRAWQRAPAGWVRKDMSPKPVYDRMHDLIKQQWWTKAHGQTTPAGEWKLPAFLGHHRIRVTGSGVAVVKEIELKRTGANEFDIRAG